MVFRIAELGILGLADDLFQRLFGRLHVARFERRFTQLADAPHRVRRDGDRVGQHLLRLVELAGGRDLDKSMGGRKNTAVCSAISSALVHEFTGNDTRLAESLNAALEGVRTAPDLSSEVKLELART